MKVLLINPNSEIAELSWEYRRAVAPILPQGIGYIAAVLENNGLEVIVVDQYAENIRNEQLIRRVAEENPDIVGISCLTAAMGNIVKIISGIRALKSRARIVLGNIHATVFADELLREGLADIVVRGEGEASMSELAFIINQAKGLEGVKGVSFVNNGKICHNVDREAIEDLDDLPYPAWQLFNLRNYSKVPLVALRKNIFPLQASRGCPYKCFFCSQEKMYKKVRHRSVESVADEIEHMFNRFGVNCFGFNDAYFPFSIEYGMMFCEELIKRGLHNKVKWITETRVDAVNQELLREMKEAGAYLIMYGFEVGNQGILDKTGKKTTMDQARLAMKNTRKTGILSLGLFILGLPGETRETCEDTIRFAKELDCDIAKFNIAVPLPGSKFFEECERADRVIKEANKFTSWHDWSSLPDTDQRLLFVPEGMNSKELINLQRKAMFSFYMRPRIIIRHICITELTDLCFGVYMLIRKYFGSFLKRCAISVKEKVLPRMLE